MHARTAPGSTNGGDVKLPAPGDLVFIYDGGPGLVTRLEGWALGMVELLFGDGVEATRRRMVGVYRNPAGELDIAAFVTPLAVAEAAWHLVSPAGDIVNGGPRGNGTRPSQSQAELEASATRAATPRASGPLRSSGFPARRSAPRPSTPRPTTRRLPWTEASPPPAAASTAGTTRSPQHPKNPYRSPPRPRCA
ncbi:hypothetical protein AB0P45_37350 [Streptomyces niveus]|uniref:hypothetical protein n=1 Tax=Streptomyces niveus TaxID=193462 RepID=UPI003431C9B4